MIYNLSGGLGMMEHLENCLPLSCQALATQEITKATIKIERDSIHDHSNRIENLNDVHWFTATSENVVFTIVQFVKLCKSG